MKGAELPAAASGLPSRSAEALPRADEAAVVLPRKCSGGASDGSKVGENFAVKNVFRHLWSQIVANSVRNGMSKKVANLSLEGELDLKFQKPMGRRWPETNGDRTFWWLIPETGERTFF